MTRDNLESAGLPFISEDSEGRAWAASTLDTSNGMKATGREYEVKLG